MKKGIWKLVKLTSLSLVTLLVVLIIMGMTYRAYRHRQITRQTYISPMSGIDEQMFVRVDGIDQWITIRGQNRDNPVLLLLHGGPGLVTNVYPRTFLFSWTRDFTLVQWDQPGAGKTFGKSGPLGSQVTIDRMAQDGTDLVEFLRNKLHQPKIFLLGHSWGTALGIRMALARPDLFYAYIGTGQAVSQGKYRALGYAQVLAEAHARRDGGAIRELEAIGPPPYDSIWKATTETRWATKYEPGNPSRWALLSLFFFDSDAGPGDLRDYVEGIMSSSKHFGTEVDSDDVRSLGKNFAVPFFVFQGAEDDVTPVVPVKEYFDAITAPEKQLVLIADAGHNAISTRSDEFLGLLDRWVRPLAVAPAHRGR